MGGVFGVFILLWLLILAIKYLVIFARVMSARFATAKSDKAARRNLINLGLVVGVITCLELIAPSMALTGLEPRPRANLSQQFVDQRPWFQGPLTYDELARHNPPLAILGTTDLATLKTRYGADLDQVNSSLRRAAEKDFNFVVRGRLKQESVRLHQLRATALQKVIDESDAKFGNDPIRELDAKRFYLEILQEESNRFKTQLHAELDAVNVARKTFEEAAEVASPQRLEEINALNREYSNLQSDLHRLKQFQLDLSETLKDTDQLRDLVDPNSPLPSLEGPLRIYNLESDFSYRSEVVQGPLAPLNLNAVVFEIWNGFKGDRSKARSGRETKRCYLGVLDETGVPTLQTYCEVSTVLDIEYDLTAKDCIVPQSSPWSVSTITCSDSATASLCMERWWRPNLNIVLEEDQFTVFEPRALGVPRAQWAEMDPPLSQWTVRYKDKFRPLKGAETFDWDGSEQIYPNLALLHNPKPTQQGTHIWRDLKTADNAMGLTELVQNRKKTSFYHFKTKEITVKPPRGSVNPKMSMYQGERRFVDQPNLAQPAGSNGFLTRYYADLSAVLAGVRLDQDYFGAQDDGARCNLGFSLLRNRFMNDRRNAPQLKDSLEQLQHVDCEVRDFVEVLTKALSLPPNY